MKKLLVIRNDKLGDLILTLPALKMIKSSVKDIKIDCLLDEKYSDIQCMTEYMDSAICNHENLIDEINTQNYDFSISFFRHLILVINSGNQTSRKDMLQRQNWLKFFTIRKLCKRDRHLRNQNMNIISTWQSIS